MTAAPALAGLRLRLAAVGGALLVAALDQASKYWVLTATGLPDGERIRLLPGVDLVLTWNYGISYGLFQQDSPFGRMALGGFTVVATLALLVWMLRARRPWVVSGLALIVGGALGNLVDRSLRGAVVDFVYLHAMDLSWYVFNLADCAIVAGVAALLYDSFRSGHSDAANRR